MTSSSGGGPRTISAPLAAPAQTQSFTLPPGVTFDVEAVFATIDTTGAGGAVTAELSISEQSGVVIATKSQSTTIPAGTTGTATWALRLNDEVTGGGGGGVTAATASYTSGTVNVAQNASANLPMSNAPYFGVDLFDRSTPASPKVLVGGIYSFHCVFRCVIALGGAQAAGTTFQGEITAGGGNAPRGLFTWGSAGSFVPTVDVTFIPTFLAANTVVNFNVTNSDSAAGTHTYDSPDITATLLS